MLTPPHGRRSDYASIEAHVYLYRGKRRGLLKQSIRCLMGGSLALT